MEVNLLVILQLIKTIMIEVLHGTLLIMEVKLGELDYFITSFGKGCFIHLNLNVWITPGNFVIYVLFSFSFFFKEKKN